MRNKSIAETVPSEVELMWMYLKSPLTEAATVYDSGNRLCKVRHGLGRERVSGSCAM